MKKGIKEGTSILLEGRGVLFITSGREEGKMKSRKGKEGPPLLYLSWGKKDEVPFSLLPDTGISFEK